MTLGRRPSGRARPQPRERRPYWLVEPDDGVLTVLELVDGAHREVARGVDVTVERPCPVRVLLLR